MSILRNIHGLAMVAIIAFAAMGFSNASAQATATGTANANATIAKPITILSTADLDFGTIVPNGVGNGNLTVAVSTAGARSIAGNVDGALLGGTPAAAAFGVTGRPNATYAITLPGAVAMGAMSVGTFTDSAAGASTLTDPGGTGTGSDSFTVGATLTVPETQAAGNYTASFSVIVNYN
jgi:hypothetical protein